MSRDGLEPPSGGARPAAPAPTPPDGQRSAAEAETGRKLNDAALLLPVIGFVLFTPAAIRLFGGDGAPDLGAGAFSATALYLFGCWCALILAAFGLSRLLRGALAARDDEER